MPKFETPPPAPPREKSSDGDSSKTGARTALRTGSVMSAVRLAATAEFDDQALDLLVESLVPRLAAALTSVSADEDRWLRAKEAAVYLGLSVAALHKFTAARTIPFEQDCRGGKLWFKRSELDAWRRGEWKRPGLRAA